jgi:hypothetical protein
VLWLAEEFEWFGDGPVCDPVTGSCDHNKNYARYSLDELVRMGVAMFPVLPADETIPERTRRQQRACAKYFASYLGGRVLDTRKELGEGEVLVAALNATASGLIVKIRSVFSYKTFDLKIASRPRQVILRRWLELPRPGRDARRSILPVDLMVSLLPAQPLQSLTVIPGQSGPNERIQVDLPVPASPASVVHVVLASSGGVDEKPLLSRFTLRGEELIRLGEALRVSVPIPAAHPRVRRVSVFEEQTKWAGYYVASP